MVWYHGTARLAKLCSGATKKETTGSRVLAPSLVFLSRIFLVVLQPMFIWNRFFLSVSLFSAAVALNPEQDEDDSSALG